MLREASCGSEKEISGCASDLIPLYNSIVFNTRVVGWDVLYSVTAIKLEGIINV